MVSTTVKINLGSFLCDTFRYYNHVLVSTASAASSQVAVAHVQIAPGSIGMYDPAIVNNRTVKLASAALDKQYQSRSTVRRLLIAIERNGKRSCSQEISGNQRWSYRGDDDVHR